MTNMTTEFKVLFLIFAIFVLGSCSKNDTLPSNMIGNWKVISFNDNVTSTQVIKTVSNTCIILPKIKTTG